MKICKTDMFEFPKSCVSGRAWHQKHNCYIDKKTLWFSSVRIITDYTAPSTVRVTPSVL